MKAITIPVGRPLSFDDLKALNSGASPEELAVAFRLLPQEMQDEAWESARLRAALLDWNEAANDSTHGPAPGGEEANPHKPGAGT
jgi:hypothetical protein